MRSIAWLMKINFKYYIPPILHKLKFTGSSQKEIQSIYKNIYSNSRKINPQNIPIQNIQPIDPSTPKKSKKKDGAQS